MIHYILTHNWIEYDPLRIANALVAAKTAVQSLKEIPYQREWVETLQQMELKREVAGTSQIEGAVFTDRELDAAMKETPEQLVTRSQKQARAALETYRFIARVPDDQPLNLDLIYQIHRMIITGADDDHCPPGQIRGYDQNVTFGQPKHRGAEGGEECIKALNTLVDAIQQEYPKYDFLVQALAVHYHLAAIHPFLDGNGRTARALEALMLQRGGLRDTCFIAMSNYYYDEKPQYLKALSEVRANNQDLTSFLLFGLKGVEIQSRRLLSEIHQHIKRQLFRNLMYDLFDRLRMPRKRVIQKRQIKILKLLLESDWIDLEDLIQKTASVYKGLSYPRKTVIRDLNGLIHLGALKYEKTPQNRHNLAVNLDWPTQITETGFLKRMKELPKAKTALF